MFHRQGPSFLELIRQGLSSTDQGYDLLAPKFEFTPFRTPDVVLEVVARVAGPCESLLDLCCGTGAGLRAFRDTARRRTGIDRTHGMLLEARRLLGSEVRLVKGDALKLPFASASFDRAVSFGAFGHILEDDEPTMVAELSRVLKPKGQFIFVTGDPLPAWHPGKLIAEGFNAGMRLRNALIQPPFIMYYLTFLRPRATELLEAAGFSVEAPECVFEPPFRRLRLIIATRR